MSQESSIVVEQQRRLASLCPKGSIPQHNLEAKSEELSQQRLHLETQKRAIEASTPKEVNFNHVASMLPEAASRLRQRVLEASEDDMELILTTL